MTGFRSDEIIILTGKGAWSRARSATWQPKIAKLVLPFGDDPESYRWPVAGRWVQAWTCGKPEPHDRLIELARCLLIDGAVSVLLLDLAKSMVMVRRRDTVAE